MFFILMVGYDNTTFVNRLHTTREVNKRKLKRNLFYFFHSFCFCISRLGKIAAIRWTTTWNLQHCGNPDHMEHKTWSEVEV